MTELKEGAIKKLYCNTCQKLDGLEAYLPASIVKSLHRFRFMGNEAAHELQAPSESELRLAIEVMEDLLNFSYELDYKATRLFEMELESWNRDRSAWPPERTEALFDAQDRDNRRAASARPRLLMDKELQ